MSNKQRQSKDWREELHERVKNGEVQLAEKPATEPAAEPPAPEPITTTAPAQIAAGRGTKREYDDFFSLYAEVVKEGGNGCSILDGRSGKRNGTYFLPLGFIPGPACLIEWRKGKPFVVDYTSDVGKDDSLSEDALLMIDAAIHAWQDLVEGIGQEPGPWNFPFARRLLDGHIPPRYLAMAMTRFRLGSGDAEVPFGVTLLPSGDNAMKVGKVYNPTDMAGVPAEGETLSVAVLKDGRGPVQKMIRTWALMEANFLGRFYKDGNPRDRR